MRDWSDPYPATRWVSFTRPGPHDTAPLATALGTSVESVAGRIEQWAAGWRADGFGPAIVHAADGEVVGVAGVTPGSVSNQPVLELTVEIGPDHRGRQLGAMAGTAAVHWAMVNRPGLAVVALFRPAHQLPAGEAEEQPAAEPAQSNPHAGPADAWPASWDGGAGWLRVVAEPDGSVLRASRPLVWSDEVLDTLRRRLDEPLGALGFPHNSSFVGEDETTWLYEGWPTEVHQRFPELDWDQGYAESRDAIPCYDVWIKLIRGRLTVDAEGRTLIDAPAPHDDQGWDRLAVTIVAELESALRGRS